MRFSHPEHPGRDLRLATCMNLWPAEDAGGVPGAGIRAGLSAISLPLRELLGYQGQEFGVGLWIPADSAFGLAANPSARGELIAFLIEERLDAFTFNAFPFGGFHEPGLKQRVFEPDWTEAARRDYTLAVASFGLELAREARWDRGRHLSISTHTGAHVTAVEPTDLAGFDSFRRRCARRMVETAAACAALEPELEIPVLLGLEPEPRSLAGDTRELGLMWDALDRAEASALPGLEPDELPRNIGVCLDACHAAVEFEAPHEAHARALGVDRARARPLAKFQFSSALELRAGTWGGIDLATLDGLLALDEPVYLHQTTGRRKDGELLRAGDLPEVAADKPSWQGCEAVRCHFHVPVDLARRGSLGTTRDAADKLLEVVLAQPDFWGARELHLEIETYTWALEAGEVDRVAGIAAEYRHVIALLERLGWQPATEAQAG